MSGIKRLDHPMRVGYGLTRDARSGRSCVGDIGHGSATCRPSPFPLHGHSSGRSAQTTELHGRTAPDRSSCAVDGVAQARSADTRQSKRVSPSWFVTVPSSGCPNGKSGGLSSRKRLLQITKIVTIATFTRAFWATDHAKTNFRKSTINGETATLISPLRIITSPATVPSSRPS